MKIYTIIEQNDKYIKLSSSNEITIIPIVDVILVDDNSGYISIKNTASRKTIGLIKKNVGPVPPTPVTELICKYNVTSTSSGTYLLNSNSGIEYQIIDGVQQDTVQTKYTFDTLGEHIVKYKLTGTSISRSTFSNRNALTSVTISDSVTLIDNYAFQDCSGLTSVTIGNSVTSIGDYAFSNCRSLINITIPNSVTNISQRAFAQCYNLTSVTIPNSVTSIGGGAFQFCEGLTSVTIGNGVTSIEGFAFDECSGLISITVNATTTPTLGSSAFTSNAIGRKIYVPAASVDAYKAAWSTYAADIEPIS